jgi:hypothetical protein
MSAVISECGLYRYRLERDVQMQGITIGFFGVNGSTADAMLDDATVRKWIGFTKLLGGKRFIVGNVFGYRATDVRELAMAVDPVGPQNAAHLCQIIADVDLLVPCWGSRTKVPLRLRTHFDSTLDLLFASGKPVKVFGHTLEGDPKHPLFLPYSTAMIDIRKGL